MNEQLYQNTSLGRPIDPTYPTNLAALVIMVLAGIVAGVIALITGDPFMVAVRAGFIVAFGTIFTWIIGREVDIDHDYSALLGAVVIGVLLIVFTNPVDVFGLLCLVLIARLVSRIAGPPPKLTDSISILVLAGVAMAFGTPWVLGIVVLIGFIFDAFLLDGNRQQLLFALVALVLTGVMFWWKTISVQPILIWQWAILVVVMLGYAIFIMRSQSFRTGCDVGERYILNATRVRASMGITLLAGFLLLVMGGGREVTYLLPLWGALGSTVGYALTTQLARRN